ncbi:MAG: MmcQ/YjbR family DNA-binding protein [Hyphomicrobiaceae bacterium]|nr:MmcQ/YjbR family DNA-binding protein [Hyphomicrobiaceae bacterium]
MSREIVNAVCRTLPGAEVSDPWGGGHDAWKVGGKMFACVGAVMPGVSVKTDSEETAQMLIDSGVAVKARYLHRSWVNLPWGTSEEELRHRLVASYQLVRSSLPNKAQAQLAPLGTAPATLCPAGGRGPVRQAAERDGQPHRRLPQPRRGRRS